ncbi:MAG: hypothetical protein DMG49_04055 [Acidobacteria bacterium]|nr:MAG: hypothetical protein DMG49_04055 [Acidobacteriota bacterium]
MAPRICELAAAHVLAGMVRHLKVKKAKAADDEIQTLRISPRNEPRLVWESKPTCDQKLSLAPNQNVRWPLRLPASLENCGPLAVPVMTPKFGCEIFVCGLPKFGVFVTEKAFARNWKFMRSVIRKFRNRPVSRLKKPGPRRMLRPAVP